MEAANQLIHLFANRGAPIMEIYGNGILIPNGDTTPSLSDDTDLGSTVIGTPISSIYTIENIGTADLIVTAISVPDGYTLSGVSLPLTIIPTDSSTFEVEADSILVDTFAGNVTISSNAAPYTFAVTAEAELPSGLVSWHDFDDLSTLWQDSARTIHASADADVLGAADDKSGNGYHVTQGTTADKSLLKLAVKNGRNVARFDGISDYLRKTAYADFSDNYTVFAITKLDSTGDAAQGVYSVSNGSGGTGFEIYQGTNTVSNMRDASAERAVGNVNYRDDNFHIFNQINSGSLNSFFVDNLVAQTIAYTAPNPNSLTQLDIGRVLYSGWFLKGDIGEILIFNRTLTSDERIAVRSYLNAKWAVF